MNLKMQKNIEQQVYIASRERKNLKRITFLHDSRPALGLEEKMKKNIYVSVSLDPVKEYTKMLEYAKKMQGHADMLHLDIMDGKFVERTTFDQNLVNNINQNCLTMLDVHLMCNEPLTLIDGYHQAGANIITIHYEAFEDKNQIVEAFNKIRKGNALVGLSFKPNTEIKDIKMFLHDVDIVLVMSVEPGLSGQKFIPNAIEKIKELDNIRKQNNFTYKIEVDGGIDDSTAKDCVKAGVDILVSGSYIFNAKNQIEAIKTLKS